VISLGAIALSGGKSSRMGQDKALLEIAGKTLLQKTCEVAQTCDANPILIITPWQERYKSISLPRQCCFIPELNPQSPLTGFALGLSFIETDWVLLLACDLPNLQSEIVKTWSQELVNLPSEAIAYLPKHSKGWEPLCGFYRSSCVESLKSYIQTGKYSFQDWLGRSLVIEIPNIDPQMLLNCNTLDDFLIAKKRERPTFADV